MNERESAHDLWALIFLSKKTLKEPEYYTDYDYYTANWNINRPQKHNSEPEKYSYFS